ncbi:hemolysin family protein [Anaerolineales bacterium HSG24]|nr:hemolysin family protein [Anaerolineales bacterium HSG24]
MSNFLLFGLPSMLISNGDDFLSWLSLLIVPILIIIMLTLLNGLFVLAEFSLIGAHPNQLEKLADNENQEAKKLLHALNTPSVQNHYILLTQIGIAMTSIGVGMYGQDQFNYRISQYLIHRFGVLPNEPLISILIGMSLLICFYIVIGELVPKAIALSAPNHTIAAIFPLLRLMYGLLQLPILGLDNLSRLVLHLMRIPLPKRHARLHSPAELERIISESADEGLFKEEEEEIILNIFDFGDRQAGQVMTPRPKIDAIPHDMSLTKTLALVGESQYSRFPVIRADLDHIIGILHINDLMRHVIKHQNEEQFDLRLLIRPAPVVPEQFAVDKLLAAFRRQRIHMAIVLDEFGGTAGIVTLEDLVEEVVGEVRDEFDLEAEPFVEISPGVIELSGRYLLTDLADDVELGPEEEWPDIETVGGLITTKLGRPPRINDQVSYRDITFSVLAIDGLAVAQARVEFSVDKE